MLTTMSNFDVSVLQTIAMIERVSPNVARDIHDAFDTSIVEYARHFYQVDHPAPTGLVTFYRDKLAAKVSRRGAEMGMDLPTRRVLDTLTAFPIIQTAPHCQLYFDAMAFWAYLIGWIGARESGCPLMPVFNTATVTLQSQASSGPAWLTTARGAFNITTSPSSRLSSTSVCGAGNTVAFDRAKVAAVAERAAPAERPGIAKLERSVASSDRGFADATDRTNVNLLRGMSRTDIVPVMFSESLVCDLMADLLTGNDPLICAMLFEPARSARLRAGFERATTQLYGHFWSQATNHFWGIRDRRIRKLDLRDGSLVEVDSTGPDSVRVRYERAAVADALRSGLLVPNLFWSFVLVALLPRLSAIGGTRQIGYLNGFADVFCRTLDLSKADEAELHESLRTHRLCFWGAKVIEHMPSPLAVLSTLPAGEELEALHDQFRSITLGQATKNLEIFKGHQRWRHVSA